jgi:hypothetical protein
MAGLLTMILAAQVTFLPPATVYGNKPPVVPPSLRPGVLRACAPTTLDAAEKCLIGSLSAEDIAIVRDRIPARQFRPSLDCQIEDEWRLADPTAPMARVMREKLGTDNADFAAGMIISDIQSRAMGIPLDFDQMRQRLQQSAPPPFNECETLKANNAALEQKNAH